MKQTNIDKVLESLKTYSADYLAYKVDAEFAQAVEDAINIIEQLDGGKYEDAEKHGLHITMPCKVGDTVYGCPYSWTYKGIDEADILDWRVACIHYSINKTGNIKATVRATVWACEKGKNYALLTEDIPFSDFGKTIFPTPEAAYAALKGGKNNEI